MKINDKTNERIGEDATKLLSGKVTAQESTARKDVIVLFILSVVVFAIAFKLETFERIVSWAALHENWEVDEFLTLWTIIPVSLAIFAIRRWKEYRQELIRRLQAEKELIKAKDELELRVEQRTAELKESRDRFRDLVENTNDWVWEVNETGVYTYVSPRLLDILGYEPQEVLNKTHFDLMDAEEAHLVSNVLSESAMSRKPFTGIETTILHKAGHRVTLETNAAPFFGSDGSLRGYRGIDRDISERKQTEEAIRESHENFVTFFETMDDIIVVAEPGGKIRYTNSATSQKLGYTPDELKTMHVLDLNPESQRQEAERIFSEMFGGERNSCPLPLEKKDGTLVPTETRVWFGKWSGIDCIFGICKDLSREREAFQKFNRLFYSNPALMAVSSYPERKFTEVNDSFVSTLGFSREEIIGKSSSELGFYSDPEMNQLVAEALRESGRVNNLELQIKKKDGTLVDGLLQGEIIDNQGKKSFLSVMVDITARKEAEEALRESEERQRSLVEHLPQRIFIKDRNSIYLSCNRNYASDIGITSEQIVGKNDFEFYPTELAQAYRADDQACMATGIVKDIEEPYQIGSQEMWIHTIKVPYHDTQGRVIGVLGIFGDITDRKRLAAERLEMERKLLHAQKLESLTVMAGGIAHDFNNQLAVVLGNLELALNDLPPESEAKTGIINAIRASERSVELSRQMLIYSGSHFYVSKDIHLGELLNRNVDLMKSGVPKAVSLNVENCVSLPHIHGDPDQLQRVIMNLVLNASEAIGDNSGEVTIRTRVMDCDERYLGFSCLEKKPEPGRFVFLEVSDNGCGMDAETQRKLFDPFFTTKFWGRGLGMAEVMGIVKGHHGAIILDSTVGKGTTARVLFPAQKEAQVSSVKVIEEVETKVATTESVNRRKTILLIEDETGVRRLAVRRLDTLGYWTIVAMDGEEGVSLFRERLNDIDLVMLDFAMPKMNGVETFGELITIKPDVKVILTSGYTEDVVLHSFPEQRPAGVLHKPYKMGDLKRQLERLLGTENSDLSKDVNS
jgi:two-component system, cell cycle sensor histidine kinase and response regulator CckA